MDQPIKATYEHVFGHKDQHKVWWQLTLVEWLNCFYDKLAKAAVTHSLMSTILCRDKYLLSLEHAAMYVGDPKYITKVSGEVHHCLG